MVFNLLYERQLNMFRIKAISLIFILSISMGCQEHEKSLLKEEGKQVSQLKQMQVAPNFTLETVEGRHFELRTRKKSAFTLLVFYRGDFCHICIPYLAQLNQKLDKFESLGCQVIAISSDKQKEAMKTKNRNQLKFPILVNMPKVLAKDYGLYWNEKESHGEPGLVLLDNKDQVIYVSIQSGPLGRTQFEDILIMLEYLTKQKNVNLP